MFKNVLLRQFISFSLVGSSNTIIDLVVYLILTRGFPFWAKHYILANIVAFIVATTNSYYLNKHWTFKSSDQLQPTSFVKFFIITGSGFIMYTLLFAVLLRLGWYDLVAKAVLIIVVLFWNFTMTKLWAFAEPKR